MIEEPPLLTIRRPTRRPTDAQIAAFQGVPSSFVVDAMYGFTRDETQGSEVNLPNQVGDQERARGQRHSSARNEKKTINTYKHVHQYELVTRTSS